MLAGANRLRTLVRGVGFSGRTAIGSYGSPGILLPLPILQGRQSVCLLELRFDPPRERGMMWSIVRSSSAPQLRQR